MGADIRRLPAGAALVQEKQPDVLFFIYNDHVTSFFFDHYSTSHSAWARSTRSPTRAAARAICRRSRGIPRSPRTSPRPESPTSSIFVLPGKPLDHGCFSPLSVLWPHAGGWPGAIVPLQVGVLEFPIPTARRCFRLGKSLRRAIESYPEDLKVAIVATGGLSHQVHGERAGFNNTPWDTEFLELLEKQPERADAS